MRTSALFGAKISDFLKFVMCPHGQGERGLSQCGHFVDKGEGVNILRERPLWTILYRSTSIWLCNS